MKKSTIVFAVIAIGCIIAAILFIAFGRQGTLLGNLDQIWQNTLHS